MCVCAEGGDYFYAPKALKMNQLCLPIRSGIIQGSAILTNVVWLGVNNCCKEAGTC